MDCSGELGSNPERFDLGVVQPVTVQFKSRLGLEWLRVCEAPIATIHGGNRDPVVLRRDLNV